MRGAALFFTLTMAVSCLVSMLYGGELRSPEPQSDDTRRNTERRARYAARVTAPELATEYGISQQGVHRILRGKRK